MVRKFKFIYLMLILFFVFGSIVGCGGGGQERPEPKPDEKEKIPPALTTMDESIHNLIENIEGIDDVIELKPEDIKPQEGQQQGGQGQEEEGQSQEEGQQDGAQQSFAQQLSPEEEQEIIQKEKDAQVLEKWESSEDELKSIHESWNEYESTALKDGADTGKIDQMENALNNLTSYIEEQDKDKVLIEANNIILSLSNFMDFYKGNVEGVLGKIEYMARQSYMDAKENNWTEAGEKAKQGETHISTLRQRADIKEEQKPLIEKLTLSIEDLEKAIVEENLNLLEIKRDIVIKNVETLKEELK
jgi:hypothetical protein